MRVAVGVVLAMVCWGGCVPDSAVYRRARTSYYAVVEGDGQRLEQAVKDFGALHEQCASSPEVLAYWGSLQLLEASDTWALWRKNRLSKTGIQAMDEAVQDAPENLEVRFVRAATTYNLPAVFGRHQQSAQDFRILADHAEAAVRAGTLDPRLAAASLYFHAEFLHQQSRNADAVQNWRQAIRVDPQSRAARDAANELKKYQ